MGDEPASRIPWIAGFAAIVVLAGAVYLPTVNRTAIWEDQELITGTAIGYARTPLQCFTRYFIYHYYRPLTSLSILIDQRLSGENPTGYHVTNVLLHMAGTGFVLAFFAAAFRSRIAALLGGALFAVQPIQFLTTAWIGGRTDTLSMLFVAVFGWSLVRAVRAEGRPRWAWLIISAGAYGFAAMAKEQALMLILLVPLAFHCFRGDEAPADRGIGWVAMAPFAIVAATFVFAWFRLAPPDRQEMPTDWAYQLGIAGRTALYYGTALTVPHPTWLYAITLLGFLPTWMAAAGYGLMAEVAVLFLVALRKTPRAAWFIAMAAVTILPVLNFIPMVSLLVGPFRAAMAGMALCGLFGWLVAGRMEALRNSGSRAAHLWAAGAGLYLIACAALVIHEAERYRDEVTVNETFVRINPMSVFTHLELAAALIDAHRIAEARRELDLVAFNFHPPKFGEPRQTHPLQMGDYDSFLAQLLVRTAYPLYTSGDKSGAKDALAMAYGVAPNNIWVLQALADLSYSEGDLNNSQECLRRALLADPTLTNRRLARAQILMRLGRLMESKTEFEECLRRSPNLGPAKEGLMLVSFALEHPQAAPGKSGRSP